MTLGARAAAQDDAAAMFLDDALADPQAETYPGDFLCGHEGFKDAPLQFNGDAVASVGNCNTNAGFRAVVTGASQADANVQAPTLRHGIESVTYQVGEHLAQFAREAAQPRMG